MKFSKLPKAKRNQLILVVLATVAVLGALGFGLIRSQYDKLRGCAERQEAAEAQLKKMQDTVKRTELVESVLNQTSQLLAEQEAGMARGDLYSWMLNTVRKFQKGYDVDIPQLSPVSTPMAVNLLSNVPYKQATMQLGGSAYYHELSQFIADFENAYPLIRVVNLTVDLNRSPTSGEREKLAFRMDLVALVKSGQP